MVNSLVRDEPVVCATWRTTTRIGGMVVVVDVGGKVGALVAEVNVVVAVPELAVPELVAVVREDEAVPDALEVVGPEPPAAALGPEGNTGPEELATALS